MKKLQIVALKRERKRLTRIVRLRERRLNESLLYSQAVEAAPKQYVSEIGRAVHRLVCPSQINISDDYEETVKFLEKVRLVAGRLKGKLHVDLTSVNDITPAGALLLVAEFDRWRELSKGRRLAPVSLEKWNPEVRRKLREMGFFEVLNAKCDFEDEATIGADRYLPFFSGSGSEGEQAKKLRQAIESLGPHVADRGALYDGLVEAMTNVKHHAYSALESVPRWWMSACVNVESNRMTVMILDHGVGIPATLPKGKMWEQVRGFLSAVGATALKDDAQLIRAALSLERSATGEDYRGNGLRQDVRGYIETHQATGRLRVISRRGKCIFEKEIGGSESMRTSSLKVPLRGTFLEWVIEGYAANEHQNN